MKNYLSIKDVADPIGLMNEALKIKKDPMANTTFALNKVLGLVFFNSSLRTRMSTTRAAYNLGMKVITLNVTSDSWQLEFEDGAVMDQGSAEHIKDAVPVMSAYCDILGVRSFPGLVDREKDYNEKVMHAFAEYSSCPIINLESATVHPLQSLADLMTIEELKKSDRPKVVLTWAPHIKALPQSVANSFCEWMSVTNCDFVITHPDGMNLSEEFAKGAVINTNQDEALEDADFVYVKNWSSFHNYGRVRNDQTWMITQEKMKLTNEAKLMHCLPVRRNVVISDDALDSHQSVIYQQAENRTYAAQAVLQELLSNVK